MSDTAPSRIAPTRAAELLDLPVQTTDTAAELLQMSPSSIQRLINAGDLRAFRVGRLVRINTADLLTWIGQRSA